MQMCTITFHIAAILPPLSLRPPTPLVEYLGNIDSCPDIFQDIFQVILQT